MSGSLEDYKKKRDFGRTPEPAPGRRDGEGEELVFVVHRHEARRLRRRPQHHSRNRRANAQAEPDG